MLGRKTSQNQIIIPRDQSPFNEQILFKEKLQFEKKIIFSHLDNGQEEKIILFKEKLIQGNAINEEDGYNLEVYNNSISKDKNFLTKDKNNNKFKTIPVYHYLNGLNKKKYKFNNHKKFSINNNYQNYSFNSIELNNNLNLNSEENEKNIDDNTNNLINNINIFKMVINERRKYQLLNRMLLKENKSEKNIIEIKQNNNGVTNKFSKRFKKKISQNIDNGIIKKHAKVASQPFNGPYLRKNKMSSINPFKHPNKSISKSKSKSMININDDEIHSQNINKIKPETKNLYSRYSKNNINEQKPNVTNKENDKINKKSSKLKINVNNSYNNIKKKYLEKSNGCTCQKDNNYIFNLKFYNICNNNQNNNVKKKSKSNSLITEYNSKENIYEDSNTLKENNPKNNIIKKRVIFEEEYIIDSNGNQKFLCVKRVGDSTHNEPHNINLNKRNYTSNNILSNSKNLNAQKIIDYNYKNNNKIVNGKLLRLKKKEKRLEAKTVFISPQMSYENVFYPSNNLAKSQINNSDKKDIKNESFIPNNKIEENNSKLNNIKIIKEVNNTSNNKSRIFKYYQNNNYHCVNNNNNNNNYYINTSNKPTSPNNNIENKEKIKYNKINRIQIINKEHPLNQRNQIKKKFEGEKSQTIKNSRNYNNPNFINIYEYNNKEIYNLKSAANEKKDNKKYTYTTTNFDNNKIFFPPGKFSNNSQKSNYQFHEIKSTSRDKYSHNIINSANKSHNNNFYFESENRRPQMIVCTSMDNIKKLRKNSNNFDEAQKYQIKDRLEKYNRVIKNQKINLDNQKNPLCFSQEIKQE